MQSLLITFIYKPETVKKKKKKRKHEMENNVELLKPPEIYLLLIYRNSNRNLLKQTFRVDIFRH